MVFHDRVFSVSPWLTWNLLCAGIKGAHHHTQNTFCNIKKVQRAVEKTFSVNLRPLHISLHMYMHAVMNMCMPHVYT